MTHSTRPRGRIAAGIWVLLAVFAAFAIKADSASTTIRTVFSFTAPNGYFPSGLVQASDGNFYGTTSEGDSLTGSYGTVFRVTPAGVLTTLHTFTRDVDGAYPSGGLVQGADGSLYGLTSDGGTAVGGAPDSAVGTVFKIGLDGSLTTLHAFTGGADGGSSASALVLGADGKLYGTTASTVFSITPAGVLTTLHTFNYNQDGIQPHAALIQAADGNFYGTTAFGGPSNYGSVFRITPGGSFTTLHLFGDADGGNAYFGLVQGADGNLYGAASGSLSYPWGVVYKITTAGALTILHAFKDSDGAFAVGVLAKAADGSFYGVTGRGGVSDAGTVFRITSGGALSTVYAFGPTQSAPPAAGLLLASDGYFYGVTGEPADGLAKPGTVFRVSTAGAFTSLYAFTLPDGAVPGTPLVEGSDGTLYGTTSTGVFGTIFSVPQRAVASPLQPPITTLYRFDNTHGATPSGLALGSDGNLYGTTQGGGASGMGTVFQATPGGALTTLHSFSGVDGSDPVGALVPGTDGYFYGLTSSGGSSGVGTAFKISAAGAFTSLHAFDGSDGANPNGSLVQGQDGNFYGACPLGSGNNRFGILFKLTPAGALSVLHQFNGNDGSFPNGGLVLGADGNFYGTTRATSGGSAGTAFSLTAAGVFTTLHKFGSSAGEGTVPEAGLVLGSDGNFYGTTATGGANNQGTAFSMTPAGVVTTLHSFYAPGGPPDVSGNDGAMPAVALVQGPNGDFYGTSGSGGSDGLGAVFELGGPPLIPQGLAAAGEDGKIALSWNAAVDAASYSIYMGRSPGGENASPVQTGVAGNTTTVSALSNGTGYYFRIAAVNANGQSLQSAEVSATPTATGSSGGSSSGGSGGGGGGGSVSPALLLGLAVAAALRRKRSDQAR